MMEIIEIEPAEKEIIELIIMDDESRFLDWEWDSIYNDYYHRSQNFFEGEAK